MGARKGYAEAEAGEPELRTGGEQLHLLGPQLRSGSESVDQGSVPQLGKVGGLAQNQSLAHPPTESAEHLQHLLLRLVVLLQVHHHAHRGRIAHQRAIALVRLDYQ